MDADVRPEALAERMPRAIFVGLATLDVVQKVERVPGPNEKSVALDHMMAAGGPAANAAVAAARCGVGASLVTALPDHPLSDFIADDLAGCGVTVEVGATYDGMPVTASIMVSRETGDRAVVSPTLSVGELELREGALEALMATVAGAGALLLDGYFPALSLPLAVQARERGVPVIFDGGSYKPHTDAALELVDIAVVSENFAPPGTDGSPEAVLDYLAAHGVKCAAITRGANTILWRTPHGEGELYASHYALMVIDTLGAGDFFHGALAARIAAQGADATRFPADLEYAKYVTHVSLRSFGTRAWLKERVTDAALLP